jgi:antitoxin component YwqK of YwqJK toxin-antitoxin module
MKRIAFIIMAMLLAIRARAADAEFADNQGETMILTRETDLDLMRAGEASKKRVNEMFKTLSPEHRIEVQIITVSRANTGYEQDMRFTGRLTAIDAQGRRDGPDIYYSDWYQGPIRISHYKQGVLHGTERQQHVSSGKIESETTWENGSIVGIRRTFHPKGELRTETPYEGGQPHGESRTYDTQGRLVRSVRFVNGKRHGDSIDYWSSNPEVKERVVPYRDGLAHGTSKAFYLSGQVKWERPFVNNQLHGTERHYAPDGAVEREIQWANGEQVVD